MLMYQICAALPNVTSVMEFETSYDACLAIGFFDYIQEAGVFLQRMNEIKAKNYVFSLKRWTFRTLPRWIRLNASGCPVYFYDSRQISNLLVGAGWSDFNIKSLSRDYFGSYILINEI